MSETRPLSETESTYVRRVEAVAAVIRDKCFGWGGNGVRDSRSAAAEIIRKLDEIG